MKRFGFTLMELLVMIALIVSMAAIGYPLVMGNLAQVRFDSFSGQLLGHLIMAKRVAQATESSVKLELDPTQAWGYRLMLEEESGWRELSRAPLLPSEVGMQLPELALNHPTNGKPITDALRSTHAPNVYFTAGGSSSGTLVWSDGKQRAVCVVISGRAGRFRFFRLKQGGWMKVH